MDECACSISPEIWNEYGALQKKADRAKLDSYAWALEDQLNHFLDSNNGGMPTDAEARCLHLQNLLRNRTKKYSRRRRLLEGHCAAPAVDASPEVLAVRRIDRGQRVRAVRMKISDEEWRLLWRLAEGQDYVAVGLAEGITIAALKSKVWRCRRRLHREGQSGPAGSIDRGLW